MSQPYKVCPQCQFPAGLAESMCSKCGHAYRTHFVGPHTQMFPAQPQNKGRRFPVWMGVVGGCCAAPFALIATIAMIGSLMPHTSPNPTQGAPQPVAAERTAPIHVSLNNVITRTAGGSLLRGQITNVSDKPVEYIVIAADYGVSDKSYQHMPGVPDEFAATPVVNYDLGRPERADLPPGQTVVWAIGAQYRDEVNKTIYLPRKESLVALHVYRLYSRSGRNLAVYGNVLGWHVNLRETMKQEAFPEDVTAEELPFTSD